MGMTGNGNSRSPLVVDVVEDLVEKVVMLFMDRREGGEIASTVGDGEEESDNCVKGDLLGSVSNR